MFELFFYRLFLMLLALLCHATFSFFTAVFLYLLNRLTAEGTLHDVYFTAFQNQHGFHLPRQNENLSLDF